MNVARRRIDMNKLESQRNNLNLDNNWFMNLCARLFHFDRSAGSRWQRRRPKCTLAKETRHSAERINRDGPFFASFHSFLISPTHPVIGMPIARCDANLWANNIVRCSVCGRHFSSRTTNEQERGEIIQNFRTNAIEIGTRTRPRVRFAVERRHTTVSMVIGFRARIAEKLVCCRMFEWRSPSSDL